jgi:hypothetical protein
VCYRPGRRQAITERSRRRSPQAQEASEQVVSENAVTREASGADGASRGPIFVSGRQHSGNTVVAVLLGRLPGCLAQIDENAFFEHRRLVDNLQDAASRAERVFELLRLEHDGARAPVHEHLRRLARDRPRITALELYRDGMDFAAHFAGKRFWVQKATSYIFYGHEILSSMPDARMICLVRNPYDIVASRKRRNERRERIWSTMVSWNRGMTIVRSLEAQFPHRLRLVSYEDLTSRPEETVRSLVAWIGEPFDPACLDVPHVNRSETTYSLSGDGKGAEQDARELLRRQTCRRRRSRESTCLPIGSCSIPSIRACYIDHGVLASSRACPASVSCSADPSGMASTMRPGCGARRRCSWHGQSGGCADQIVQYRGSRVSCR